MANLFLYMFHLFLTFRVYLLVLMITQILRSYLLSPTLLIVTLGRPLHINSVVILCIPYALPTCFLPLSSSSLCLKLQPESKHFKVVTFSFATRYWITVVLIDIA